MYFRLYSDMLLAMYVTFLYLEDSPVEFMFYHILCLFLIISLKNLSRKLSNVKAKVTEIMPQRATPNKSYSALETKLKPAC